MIDGLCQRYSCLPSMLLAEDADLMLRMHQILAKAHPEDEGDTHAGNEMSMEQQLAGISTEMPADAMTGF